MIISQHYVNYNSLYPDTSGILKYESGSKSFVSITNIAEIPVTAKTKEYTHTNTKFSSVCSKIIPPVVVPIIETTELMHPNNPTAVLLTDTGKVSIDTGIIIAKVAL